MTNALVDAARDVGVTYHTGVVECKDSFYGQHQPEKHACLLRAAEQVGSLAAAWAAIASEMESAALFIAGQLTAACGSAPLFLVVGNQERAKKPGCPMPSVHDTDARHPRRHAMPSAR